MGGDLCRRECELNFHRIVNARPLVAWKAARRAASHDKSARSPTAHAHIRWMHVRDLPGIEELIGCAVPIPDAPDRRGSAGIAGNRDRVKCVGLARGYRCTSS